MARKGIRTRNRERNKIERNGLTFKTLEASEGTGFVLRVFDTDTEPPKITSIVQQPGHDTITAETLLFPRNTTLRWGDNRRFAPAQPAETEDTSRIAELLRIKGSPLAITALQQLLAVVEIPEA